MSYYIFLKTLCDFCVAKAHTATPILFPKKTFPKETFQHKKLLIQHHNILK